LAAQRNGRRDDCWGQKRRIDVFGAESGLPPIAAVPLHCGEPTFWATTRREQVQKNPSAIVANFIVLGRL
jgi:hypothetical protein